MVSDLLTARRDYEINTSASRKEETVLFLESDSIISSPIFEKPPVRIEGGSIVCSYEMMVVNKLYPVGLDDHIVLARKNEDGTIDLYELVVE